MGMDGTRRLHGFPDPGPPPVPDLAMPRPGLLQGLLQGQQLLLPSHEAGEPRAHGLQNGRRIALAPTSAKTSTGSGQPLDRNGPGR